MQGQFPTPGEMRIEGLTDEQEEAFWRGDWLVVLEPG